MRPWGRQAYLLKGDLGQAKADLLAAQTKDPSNADVSRWGAVRGEGGEGLRRRSTAGRRLLVASVRGHTLL
jgi:hypothetical protein